MFTTSFTTSVAFIATASSPVMPISAFGYFAACTVIMNYVLVMTVFPCLLLVWHKTGSKSCCCCDIPAPCFGSIKPDPDGTNWMQAVDEDSSTNKADSNVDQDQLRPLE
eukprot:SAG31_NODE_24412_length_482_cov_0.579634_1_plen_108_part_10